MKIIAPIKKEEYVDIFANAGADELYGSCVLNNWHNVYGNHIEYNRRGNYGIRANCENEQSFLHMVERAANRGVPFYLTANALKITDRQADLISLFLKDFHAAGGHGVIISDLSLVERVKNEGLAVVVSSCAEVMNFPTVQFYQNLGCERIILPRDLTISEMKKIKTRVPDIEYEVFFMNSGCRFSDGNCLGLHATEYEELCRYCDRNTAYYYDRKNRAENIQVQPTAAVYENILQKACSVCNIYDLTNIADSLKIVERVANEGKILSQIQMAKKNIEIAQCCCSKEEYLEKMEFPSEAKKRCDAFLNCYYRTDMISYEKSAAQKIAKEYAEYKATNSERYSSEYIDYIGINIAVSQCNQYQFKTYYTPKASSHISNDLIRFCQQNDMIRHLTCIHDSSENNRIRADVGLKHRTNKNMRTLFDEINKKTDFFTEDKSLIESFSKMEISDNPDYLLSSLYFFGFIEQNKLITDLKFHFLNRFCNYTDSIGKDVVYRDQYYLQYLESLGIDDMSDIISLTKEILNFAGGHLWMTGVDCSRNGEKKYKVYIKNSSVEAIRQLIGYCRENRQWSGLVSRLLSIYDWYQMQSDLKFDGFAACKDTKGIYSFNFYFKLK